MSVIYEAVGIFLSFAVALILAAHLVSIGTPYVSERNGFYEVRVRRFLGRNELVATFLIEGDAYICLSRILERNSDEHDETCATRSGGWIAGSCNCSLSKRTPK